MGFGVYLSPVPAPAFAKNPSVVVSSFFFSSFAISESSHTLPTLNTRIVFRNLLAWSQYG